MEKNAEQNCTAEYLSFAFTSTGNQEASTGSPHVCAINDTAKVKRTMARTSQENVPEENAQETEPVSSQSQNQQNTDIGQQFYIPADPSPEDVMHLQSIKNVGLLIVVSFVH